MVNILKFANCLFLKINEQTSDDCCHDDILIHFVILCALLGGRVTADRPKAMSNTFPTLTRYGYGVCLTSNVIYYLLWWGKNKTVENHHSNIPVIFLKVLCTLSSPWLKVFFFLFQMKVYHSGLVLTFETRDWQPWYLSFAAPLETRGSPLIPMISPSPVQEELQTALGKFCFDVSVQCGLPFLGLPLK